MGAGKVEMIPHADMRETQPRKPPKVCEGYDTGFSGGCFQGFSRFWIGFRVEGVWPLFTRFVVWG